MEYRKSSWKDRKRIHRTFYPFGTRALRVDDIQEIERVPGSTWELVSCAVNLSVVNEEGREVAAIVRYDTAHGTPHRDELFRDPPEKVWMETPSLEAFREKALRDIGRNGRRYLEAYIATYGPLTGGGGIGDGPSQDS